MKKILLTSEGKFHLAYKSWLNKYRVKQEFVSLVEILMLGCAVIFCLGAHLIFVNQTSTKGYDVRKSRTALNSVTFDFEIEKTKILDLKKLNRDKLKQNNTSTLLGGNVEIITVD